MNEIRSGPVVLAPAVPGQQSLVALQRKTNHSRASRDLGRLARQAAGQVVQRASEYDAVLPAHVTYGESYDCSADDGPAGDDSPITILFARKS
ncbi:hypothetical protein [Roseobacter sinensis]|uniref:Uncharacterized protein n=1 Tax=Roseobacter sinensis TaxID=2931391 RepID=A0ABT3BC84_9RHOB|nr:hypothetical protein [Roseobacter sp. WL0113]MCV3271172.1 hypothetical protein [Roseobacter sp. WL0113]